MASNAINAYGILHQIGHEQDEQEGLSEFSSYYSATICMFVLGSSGVALAVIPLLLFDGSDSETTSKEVYGLLRSICFLALIVLSCFLLWYKRKRIAQGTWSHGNPRVRRWLLRSASHLAGNSEKNHAKYMMFTLLVFGIGSIVWCVLEIIENPYSWYEDVDNILNILSLCALLFFFYDFISDKLPNSSILHYAISTMIGIKMWSWIGAILEPLWDMDDFSDVNITEGTEDILEFTEEFFEPFYVEFSTIAVGVLFGIWHSIKNVSDEEDNRVNHAGTSAREIGESDTESTSSSEVDSRPPINMQYMKSVMVIAFLAGLTFTVVSALATIDEVIKDLTTRVYIYRGVTVLFFAPLVILAIVLLSKISSLPTVAASFLNSNEYVLLFTACSESIYYILRAVAAVGYMATPISSSNSTTFDSPSSQASYLIILQGNDPKHVYNSNYLAVLFLIYSIVKFSEAWLQSRLLIIARRKHVPNFVKYCLTFFVAINLSEWLKSGILLGLGRKHRSNFNPMMDAFYGPSETITIILILLPIMILFRFHAAVVAVEIINES